ncbi:nuclear protein localization protein 4 [Nematocida minor]|uniref:nuclear protein localization protein 4 n=1 Tax=Nematocida minor TaxID=1912983 RepID=UPI00221E5A7C|nr:nuclear protein localization protein 4 [Nematocida minor]XP_051332032.1 nuclear protein localization protein 4 [Nematocida minor]KAI5188762.1 nuclear protein localization protein 4 [Nematocida minor]KAI5188866.1 nuclear protein localization protein 4 [Nematocida minor]
MIIRVQGRDRTMRIEVVGTTTAEQIKEEINSRTKSVCTALLHNQKEMVGTVEENKMENGEVLTAEYEVVKEPEAEDAPSEKASKDSAQENGVCHHGPSGMCSNCMAEDSWVSEQFKERRSISQGAYEEYLHSKLKCLQIETHLPPPCGTHRAEHRCNKCIPKEIYLAQQPFRPVDHIEVHDRAIIEQILIERKEKNVQSVHFLVGRYSEYTEVPKGCKAEVFAKIAPRQKGLTDGFLIDETDPILKGEDKSLNRVLRALNMQIVGMVYTRIMKEESPFISALEVAFIARMQNAFGEWKDGERKGSRFATLILSGVEASSEIYECMATHLGMELALDGLLQASENPLEMSVKSIDVIWRDKEGAHTGSKIPVEYLVVRPTHGLTQNKRLFCIDTKRNWFKRGMGVSKLKKHFQKSLTEESICQVSLQAFSDLDVLLELEDMGILPDSLLECVEKNDSELFKKNVLENKFDEIVDIAKDCKESLPWCCNMCTLQNAAFRTICEACGLDKGSY